MQRALLSNELQRLRRDKHLKQEEVARELDWSPSKIIRIEGGSVGISTTDLQALLRLYEVVDPEQIDRLIELARGARERGWWSTYQRDLAHDQPFLSFLGYENGSSEIRQSAIAVVPGLLQTEEYARAITREYADDSRTQLLVEVRMLRQEKLLERENPPQQYYVLDEAVIRRRVGGGAEPALMANQLRHLINNAERPYVTIKVIPFNVGAHFGMKGDFTLLDFEGDLGGILYLESSRGGALTITGKDPAITTYREQFERLFGRMALDPEASLALIERAADEMSQ